MPPPSAADSDTRRFFEPLLAENPSGRRWLPRLLGATPCGRERLGELVDDPGSLHADLTLPALEGRRTCFEYPVAPPDGLVAWFIDHPDRLAWPEAAETELNAEEVVLRRALLFDKPPGSRARAQARARELAPTRSAFAREWWRFEETHAPDCLLMSDRLVLVLVEAGERLAPVTPWYPARSTLVRGLETAMRLAQDRAWGALLLSDAQLAEASPDAVRSSLPDAAPHLDAREHAALADGYLGGLTWALASAAIGD